MSCALALKGRNGFGVEVMLEVEHLIVEMRQHRVHALFGAFEGVVEFVVTAARFALSFFRLLARSFSEEISFSSFSHSAKEVSGDGFDVFVRLSDRIGPLDGALVIPIESRISLFEIAALETIKIPSVASGRP